MKKPALSWLATLAVAAATIAFVPPSGANDQGPSEATTAPSTESAKPPSSGRRDTYPFRGVVGSIDVSAQTLTLAGRETHRVVHFNDQTRLLKNGQAASLDDLRIGEQVGGTLRKTGEGRVEAVMIRIGPKSSDAGSGTGNGKGTKRKKTDDAKAE